MTDLHAAVLDRLAAVSSLSVFAYEVGHRPDGTRAALQADGAGRVYPYAVLWPNTGWTPGEARDLENDAQGGLTWDARVTVASGDPGWTIEAVRLVRARLDNWPVLRGRLVEMEGTPGVQVDPDAAPSRWFVPLTFRTLT